MIEAAHWHPVATSGQVTRSPAAAVLLEHDLVLWRDRDGTVRAWDDACPHRGARLSAGRVLDDGLRLACPYHGWQFGVDARCEAIPSAPGFQPPPGHRARVRDALERHGLVWVRLAGGGEAAPPPFDAEDDPRLRKVTCGPYDVPSSAPRVVENFLDLAHFGFVHAGSLGDPERVAIGDYQVDETPTGVVATGSRVWQPASSVQAAGGAWVEYTYAVVGPYTALLTKAPQAGGALIDGFREAIALFVCPVTPESCRVWFRLAIADFTSDDDRLRAFQDAIFAQDAPIVASQRPRRLPLDPAAELHCAADRASAAYRRMLRRLGVSFGTC